MDLSHHSHPGTHHVWGPCRSSADAKRSGRSWQRVTGTAWRSRAGGCCSTKGSGEGTWQGKRPRQRPQCEWKEGSGPGQGSGQWAQWCKGPSDHVDVDDDSEAMEPCAHADAEPAKDLTGSEPGPDVAHVDDGKNAEVEVTTPTSMEVLPSPRKPSIKRRRSKLNKLRAMAQSPRRRKQKVALASVEPVPAVEQVAEPSPPQPESLPESSEGDKKPKIPAARKPKAPTREKKVKEGSGEDDENEKIAAKKAKEKVFKEQNILFVDCCWLALGFWCDLETIWKLFGNHMLLVLLYMETMFNSRSPQSPFQMTKMSGNYKSFKHSQPLVTTITTITTMMYPVNLNNKRLFKHSQLYDMFEFITPLISTNLCSGSTVERASGYFWDGWVHEASRASAWCQVDILERHLTQIPKNTE